ncbi:MAG: hypothetical protein QM570_19300 [Planctomycetota bacterium]|nr:hypothetical protein [Planctomycetota bacterium]
MILSSPFGIDASTASWWRMGGLYIVSSSTHAGSLLGPVLVEIIIGEGQGKARRKLLFVSCG